MALTNPLLSQGSKYCECSITASHGRQANIHMTSRRCWTSPSRAWKGRRWGRGLWVVVTVYFLPQVETSQACPPWVNSLGLALPIIRTRAVLFTAYIVLPQKCLAIRVWGPFRDPFRAAAFLSTSCDSGLEPREFLSLKLNSSWTVW